MPFLVQKQQCSTCIFRPENAGMLPQLLVQIRDPKFKDHFKSYRVCHHSDVACCAGFWARHKDHFDLGQIAQRLDLIEFVNHDTLKGKEK
jgi:hypothetical protein